MKIQIVNPRRVKLVEIEFCPFMMIGPPEPRQ